MSCVGVSGRLLVDCGVFWLPKVVVVRSDVVMIRRKGNSLLLNTYRSR